MMARDPLEGLSPEQIATLADIANRAMHRRSRQGQSGASVRRTGWTPKQAKLHARRNDLKTMEGVLATALKGREKHDDAIKHHLVTYERIKAELEELEADPEAQYVAP